MDLIFIIIVTRKISKLKKKIIIIFIIADTLFVFTKCIIYIKTFSGKNK